MPKPRAPETMFRYGHKAPIVIRPSRPAVVQLPPANTTSTALATGLPICPKKFLPAKPPRRRMLFWGTFLSLAAGRLSSVVPARARAGQFRALAEALTFLMDLSFVLRLQSVSPFTSGRFRRRSYSGSAAIPKEEATKAAFSSPAASPGPFRRRLIGTAYRPSGGVGLHRSWSRTIFSRRLQAAPAWPVADNRTPGHVRIIRTIPDASD